MLHRLPSGDWVDLTTITGLRVLGPIQGADLRHGWRLVINTRNPEVTPLIRFEDQESAEACRDELAGLVNRREAPVTETTG